ncbi:hypothetical protein ABMA10_07235 [Plantibacter sp. RU18]
MLAAEGQVDAARDRPAPLAQGNRTDPPLLEELMHGGEVTVK